MCVCIVLTSSSFVHVETRRKAHAQTEVKGNNCCLNGGTCILNTFCHCPKSFYGRFCENGMRHKSCGTIRHGTWMASGCHLCHCFDGNMRCKATEIPGCEHQAYEEGRENNPDFLGDLDNKIKNPNDFYQKYDEYQNDVTSASETFMLSAPAIIATLTMLLVISS
ncbi:uncharacterized protein LOC127852638 [Dreissena polymorpha]|nr:uncharacterized protein LOC127852638 [Dreissena polymorpha]